MQVDNKQGMFILRLTSLSDVNYLPDKLVRRKINITMGR